MFNRIARSRLALTPLRAMLALAAVALLVAGGFLALSLTPGQTDVASAHGGRPSDHGVTITKSSSWPTNSTFKTGQSATYTVVLDDTQVPTEHYTAVEPTLTNTNANFTVSPAIVWFTPSNYKMPRTFTVTAKQDNNDNTDGSATITHELSIYTAETTYTRHSLSDDGVINVIEKDVSECPTIDIDSAIGNDLDKDKETYRVTGQRWRWNTDAANWGDRNDCRSWASEGNRSGKWTPARFYKFTIPPGRDARDVTVTMETQHLDGALFLRQNAKHGGILARDADLRHTNGKPVSRVRKNLGPGTYYIEATTPGWNQDWNGSEARPGTFKITVTGIKNDIDTTPECDVHSLAHNGAADTYNTWDGSCDSFWVKPYKKHPTRSNARWWKFSVAERGLYTITLKSNEANAWLFLRSGADDKSGDYLVQNNRDVARGVPFKHNFPWDSRIQRWMDPGDYTVEATNWSSGISPPHVTGPFTLKVREVKLSAANPLATSASLSLSGWDTDPVNNDIEDDGPWYYQANAGPHAACSTAQSGTTVNLTGLSPDTAYTYDAYQDAECTSLIATTTLRTRSSGFVINNDAATPVSVTEGGTTNYQVKLRNLPSANVTVTIAEGTGSNDDTDITVTSSKTLTFTTENWGTAQTVTLSAAADTDKLDGSRDITHTGSSTDANYNGATGTLTATETETTKGMVFSSGRVSVPEGGEATYTVRLSVAPTGGDTTVTLTEKSDAPDNDPHITVFRPSPPERKLTFTSNNWKTPQTVTLRAAEDPDTTAGTRIIGHVADGGGYSRLTDTVLATEVENDQSIVLSPTALNVNEGGSATYTVKLNLAPTANVNVALTGAGDNSITFSPSSLAFTPQNYDTARTVTVRAAQDTDVGHGSKTITHTATSADANYNNGVATLTVTEQDDDTASARILLRNAADSANITTLNVTEGDTGGASYSVKLSHKPGANVTVTLGESTTSPNNDTDITVKTPTSKTLTFTPNNYSTAQTVTLQAAADADTVEGVRDIIHTANGQKSGYSDVKATLKATETEKGIVFSSTSVSVPEGGTATYTVRLSFAPSGGDTTVTMTENSDAPNNDPHITVSSPSNKVLTFNSNNWETPQTVTLSAEEDPDSIAGTRLIGHVAAGGGYPNITQVISATEVDNDGGGGNITPGGEGEAPAGVGSVSASRSGGSIAANWNAPDGATKYHVTYTTDGGSSWSLAASAHDTNSISIANADAGKAYIVGVRAGNDHGWSGWVNSNTVPAQSQQQQPQPANPPASVSGLSASRSSGNVTASWNAPDGATKYHVTYTTDGGKSWSLAASAHTSTSISINAANDKAYTVGVRAGNDAGWSGWVNSNEVPKVVTPPASVGSVSATHNGSTVSVTWDAVSGATKYHVTYSTDGGSSWSLAASERSTNSITIANADSAKTYVVGVRAGNTAGWSGWTNSAPASHGGGGG